MIVFDTTMLLQRYLTTADILASLVAALCSSAICPIKSCSRKTKGKAELELVLYFISNTMFISNIIGVNVFISHSYKSRMFCWYSNRPIRSIFFFDVVRFD